LKGLEKVFLVLLWSSQKISAIIAETGQEKTEERMTIKQRIKIPALQKLASIDK